MANPFTSVTVSGYNTSPPSDDGSAVATNQLQWSKHKTKIGDPLKTAIESINTNALAAFGKRIGTTFEAKSSAYPIVPGDQGKVFSVTGTTTITLPAVADVDDGFPVIIINKGVGTVTVDGNASELIDGDTSLTLAAEEWAILTTDGSTWTAGVSRVFSGVLTAHKTANTSRTNTDEAAADPHLAVAFLADTYYAFDAVIVVSSASGTPDFKYAFGLPGGTVVGHFQAHAIDEVPTERTFAGNWTATPFFAVVPDELVVMSIKGTFKMNVGGTLTFFWAQNVSDAAATIVMEGSYIKLTELSD